MPGRKLDRRLFLKLSSTAAIGSGLFYHPYQLPAIEKKRNVRFKLSKPQWIIYDNGSYDLISNDIVLKNCRPAINGQGVMPKNVFLGDSPKGKRIVYELPGGFLMLDLKTNRDSISIGTELSGFSKAPEWLYPISQAEVIGAKHFFQQGFKTGDKSGIYDIQQLKEKIDSYSSIAQNWSHDSFLTFGLLAENETIAVGNIDHKDFLQRGTIYNRIHGNDFSDDNHPLEKVFFESALYTEGIYIENEYIKLPELHFVAGNKPLETLQVLAWKQSENNEARIGSVTSYYWVASPPAQKKNSLDYLESQINHLRVIQPPLPVHSVVIDKGYCITGDWLELNKKWPGGIDRAAREIFKNGYRAGIWLAPFLVDENSKIYKNHPDWVLRTTDDNPVTKKTDDDESFYILDISNHEVVKHLTKIFRALRKAGFIFFETAYLDAGFRRAVNVKNGRKEKTSVQLFRNVLSIIREEIGPGSLWLADHAPFASVIGFADMVKTTKCTSPQRVKIDVNKMIEQSYSTHYFNNIFWQNDPGTIKLSGKTANFSEQENKSLALWNAFLGGAVGTSSDIATLTNEEINFFRFLEPDKRSRNAILPNWPDRDEIKIAIREYRSLRSWGILFYNDKTKPIIKTFHVNELIDENEIFVFGWELRQIFPFGEMQEILVNLQPGESRLFYFCRNNEPPPPNITLAGKTTDG